MPEAAVHEDDGSANWKDDVWTARQGPHMQPVAIAEAVKEPTHQEFWTGVRTPDARHQRRALGPRHDVE
jgi:hypothetical protein